MPSNLLSKLETNFQFIIARVGTMDARLDILLDMINDLKDEIKEMDTLIEASEHLLKLAHPPGSELNPINID